AAFSDSRLDITACLLFFSFTQTACSKFYTLSLHDALPICQHPLVGVEQDRRDEVPEGTGRQGTRHGAQAARRSIECCTRGFDERSEEHTSELQSRFDLVCRLLLEKKNKDKSTQNMYIF